MSHKVPALVRFTSDAPTEQNIDITSDIGGWWFQLITLRLDTISSASRVLWSFIVTLSLLTGNTSLGISPSTTLLHIS